MKKRILSIDPSVMNSAGWSTVDFELGVDGRQILAEDFRWGAWKLNGFNFQQRCGDLKDYIQMEIGHFDELICEWPMFYESAKGQTSARQGHTINLAGIAMFIAGWFHCDAKNLFLYTAPDWKGSVTKKVTAKRFFKTFGVDPINLQHDAVDATMMLVRHCQRQGYYS